MAPGQFGSHRTGISPQLRAALQWVTSHHAGGGTTWREFRDFITKGNLLQLVVTFIMGVAFGTLVKSFVNDLIMPIIGKLVGNVDFANLYVNLPGQAYPSAAAREAGASAIYYGAFTYYLVNSLLIAVVVFLLVGVYQRMPRPTEEGPPTTKDCPYCRTSIPIGATRCPNCTSELRT